MQERDSQDLKNWADMIQAQIDEEEAEVFSATVLREARNPSNYGPMEDPDTELQRTGTCGDTVRLHIKLDGDRIQAITFLTDGCGATLACNSMMSKMVKGKTVDQALELTTEGLIEALDGLPDENLHCAELAVGTLRDAIIRFKRR
jgi:nitrogen fixation NifU-like protein